MKELFHSIVNRTKNIRLNDLQEKAAEFGDKAKIAFNDIDVEKINIKKRAIGSTLSELGNKNKSQFKQIIEKLRQSKRDYDIEKARKQEEKRLRRKARALKTSIFFKKLTKIFVLFILIGVLLSIIFFDDIKRFELEHPRKERQIFEQQTITPDSQERYNDKQAQLRRERIDREEESMRRAIDKAMLNSMGITDREINKYGRKYRD